MGGKALNVPPRDVFALPLDIRGKLTDFNLGDGCESRGPDICPRFEWGSTGDYVAGTDIFLSYARADQATARNFAECFGQEGFSVWWDASLHSGQTFDEVIEQNLRDAKAVVVLWSPRSVASRWVRAEATLADRRNKLAPAIIEPCDRPIIFELTHAADLTEWAGDTSDPRWRNFMHDLRRLVQAEGDAGAVPAPASPAVRPEPAIPAKPAPAASRQPLRPGSSEVIFAGRASAEPLAHRQPETAPIAQDLSDEDVPSDVHYLEVEDEKLAQEPFEVDSGGVKIGRTPPADLVLAHQSVSREHCIISLANDELFVTDLNSTNGTYIDDERIRRATVLPVGSVVRVGQISLRHAVRPRSGASDEGLHKGRVAAMR